MIDPQIEPADLPIDDNQPGAHVQRQVPTSAVRQAVNQVRAQHQDAWGYRRIAAYLRRVRNWPTLTYGQVLGALEGR